MIQRLIRINRIGQKVFDTLYIYNFFPTEEVAEVVKSREIAAHKMFPIHNTLGEENKIFAPGTPTPDALFQCINCNPEELEEESLLTCVRREGFALQEQHSDIVQGLEDFPPRAKTAKRPQRNALLVFRRKGLQRFIQAMPDTAVDKTQVRALTLEEALEHIRYTPETPRLPLILRF